jgi:quinol monooxygenase YgiN
MTSHSSELVIPECRTGAEFYRSWRRPEGGRARPPSSVVKAESSVATPAPVHAYHRAVIFIVVKFLVKPEWVDRWMELVTPFTEATRAEPGNLWFDWSRSLEVPNEFVLVEAFRGGDAGRAHVESEHFAAAIAAMPPALLETPRIVSQVVDQDGWNEMGEMQVSP